MESPSPARSSAMSRLSSPSVQITEFSDQMNPHPVAHGNHTAEEGLDIDEKEGVLSASKLVSWCCTRVFIKAVVVVGPLSEAEHTQGHNQLHCCCMQYMVLFR